MFLPSLMLQDQPLAYEKAIEYGWLLLRQLNRRAGEFLADAVEYASRGARQSKTDGTRATNCMENTT
jgi:hypothetical protein